MILLTSNKSLVKDWDINLHSFWKTLDNRETNTDDICQNVAEKAQ